ncbi:development-specific protein LVN1.2-like [Lytechinus pictus]|uniref:development-specific protein LVN1.2-like n=1 Tax=Lytechinus pictus TaxID=7653 RepID=UPI0030BA2806
MLRLIVIAAVLVSSASAACKCGPAQYVGGLGSVVGESTQPPLGLNVAEVGAWDFVNRRFGFKVDLVYSNGTAVSYRMIQNYTEGAQWIFIDEYKFCEKQKAALPEPSNCIPETATSFGKLYIGGFSGSSETLEVETWVNTISEGTLMGSGSLSVRTKDCFPVGAQFMGTSTEMGQTTSVIMSSGWYNMTEGIPHPEDWFTLPSYCNSQESNAVKFHPMHKLNFKRFF